jgi:hypothetical protein
VTAEKASNKVVLATELATSKIELLPPILMVAVLKTKGLLIRGRAFTWASTLSVGKIVESITSTITLDSSEQEILTASGPAPLVHRSSPVRDVGEHPAWCLTHGTIVISSLLGIAGTEACNLVARSILTTVTNA